MFKVEALLTCKKLRVTDGLEYMVEVSDGGKELIILDDNEGKNSSIAYHEDGFLNDEGFQVNFQIR